MAWVLVVEDNPLDAETAIRVMEMVSPEVAMKVAPSVDRAVELLAAEDTLPAFALIDIRLPGEDGLDLVRRLRLDRPYRELPIVVWTGSVLDEDRIAATNAGADRFISKPHRIDDLIDELTSAAATWLPASFRPTTS